MNNSTMDEQSGDLGASADADRATREPSLRLGHTASVPSAKSIPPLVYDEDLIRKGARAKYAISGPFNIDRWPEAVRALSMPTKLLEIDANEFVKIFDHNAFGWAALMQSYADMLDREMGWDQHMVRLNSRSPKDASAPVMPVTCSGKQAMGWMASSERVLDDTTLMKWADAPLFIALRKWEPIRIEWEFRCFVKDGMLLGVSRYDYANEPAEDWDAAMVLGTARSFYEAHLAPHYETVVFDLALGVRSGTPLLVEINPYGLSDPCCFGSYENIETIGGFAAQAIEARSDQTEGLDPKGESVVPSGDAPNNNPGGIGD
jgi:hypothetical protein